jgi:YebC/PmpR family DNA-binding regulatory protein
MSGHSKWSTIKRKKSAVDAKRGKLFTKLAREIQIAAREGADPEFNIKLRLALEKAKAANMPKDNIERAIKKGAGEMDGVSYEEILYEGYGPHNVALIVEALTDNRNRTIASVRHAFSKGGGNLGSSNSVQYMFERIGMIRVAKSEIEEDVLT